MLIIADLRSLKSMISAFVLAAILRLIFSLLRMRRSIKAIYFVISIEYFPCDWRGALRAETAFRHNNRNRQLRIIAGGKGDEDAVIEVNTFI